MTTIKATIKDRRLEVDVPPDWPDGTEVEIHALREDDMMSPAEIARVLAAADKMQPLEMTDTEEAAWNADRLARIALEKAPFYDRLEKLRREWE